MNKLSLSAPRQRLIEEMQQIFFGHIENLPVVNGEPLWEAGTRIVQSIVLGKSSDPSPHHEKADFLLKQKVTELFDLFDHEQSLEIQRIDVQHGLPFKVLITKRSSVLN